MINNESRVNLAPLSTFDTSQAEHLSPTLSSEALLIEGNFRIGGNTARMRRFGWMSDLAIMHQPYDDADP
jgi:hypothetical protein